MWTFIEKTKNREFFCLFCTILIFCSTLLPKTKTFKQKQKNLLFGVKIYDYSKDFSVLFKEWRSLGINTAFIGTSLASKKGFIDLAKKNDITTFIIVPVFCSLDKPLDNPELYAITGEGKKANIEWVHFICPTRDNLRKKKLKYIKNLLKKYKPDGLSIDFIRYFVYWEKVYPEMKLNPLHNTCFCSNCLNELQKELNIQIPKSLKSTNKKAEWILKNHKKKWIEWKCKTITSMVKDITRIAKIIKPDILLNAHIVPWRRGDFGNAIRTVVSQDITAISSYVDYISPMCYSHMVKQSPAWIHSVVKDFREQTNKKVIPSIQVSVAYLKKKLTAEVFKESLIESLKIPSSGVVFWNWKSLDKDPQKKATLKSLKK